MKKALFTAFFALLAVLTAGAQTKPVFATYENDNTTPILGMSDNGLWAVTSGGEDTSARLIDLSTKKTTVISTDQNTEKVRDVSNDGTLVVGSKAGKPACYSVTTKEWKTLSTKKPYTYGNVFSVTPDGKLGAGVLYYNDGMNSMGALWDLETGKLIETEGLPDKDMAHEDKGQMQFNQISSDGKYILGCMSYSYLPTSLDLGGCFWYVYNRDTKVYKVIGFTETETGRWTPKADGIIVIMSATMSNNGRYVTGAAHLAKEIAGADYADEFKIPFLYDVEKDEFTAYNEVSVQDTYGSAVTNEGVVVDVTPEGNPVRDWSVRSGKYWMSFTDILKQKYNTNIKKETTYDNTGTVNCISDDGKRLASFPDPYKSYVVDLPEPLSTLGEGVTLLGSYSVSPAEGSTVSHLKNATVTFSRNVVAVGESTSAQILDSEDKNLYNSVGFTAEGKTLSVRFRKGTLDEGKSYSLFIPAGTVALSDDATQTNADIYIKYNGRKDEAVKPVEFYPENGSTFSHIDYSTSPVIVTFDTEIAIADGACGYLYRNQETEPFCQLTLAYSGNKLALYPSTLQYLYDGTTYRVEVPAGSVTDVAGNNGNDSIAINYVGNYVREISSDDVILFEDNFDNDYGNFMQWCGDQNTPTEAMQNWDFTKGMAWGLVRDDEASADRMAASHSIYSPAGQSDDWLVIPQLYIPDELCSVHFLSQSWKKAKNDVLKVVVWESDNVYNTLTDEVMAKVKAEGKVVYEEKQTPGATEDVLGGEWTQNTVKLDEFAGKNVYICFANQNNDQSAIFMDSLKVRHDMRYLTTLTYQEGVVNQAEANISGTLVGNTTEKTYDSAVITLKDASGNVVDTYTATGMNLSKGQKHEFAFSKPLPLETGVSNDFTVYLELDGEKNLVSGTIKNLAFQPVKRIVLEEYTGKSCGNCPLGILGIEQLEARYGQQFIPISIHTYNNDPLSKGLSSYTSTLGIDQLGAPSGIINRGTGCYPATSAVVDDVQRFFFTSTAPELGEGAAKLWSDYAAEEMEVPAECSIDVTDISFDDATGEIVTTCEMKYALNATNQTVNLFTVLLEDNCLQTQDNYMASVVSPDLGEWGSGGKYGQSKVENYPHQDVAKNVAGTTIYGTGGYVPSDVEAGKVYTAEVRVAVPSTVTAISQCKTVVMMIDANTGAVINAARSGHCPDTGIEEVNSEQLTVNSDHIFNLSGQRVGAGAKGIVIVNGKKIIR